MSLVSKPYTWTTGATIIASEHNSNFDIIYSDYDGNIQNVNIAANAAIADTKLGQITTASKVSGDAFTNLANIPAGAGVIPAANLQAASQVNLTTGVVGVLPIANGGTNSTNAQNTANGVVILDSNGKIASGLVTGFGAWVDKSASYGAQQAATDGFIIGTCSAGGNIQGYTDVNANPSRLVGTAQNENAGSICFPVKKSDYWKVTTTGGLTAVYWIPLGA